MTIRLALMLAAHVTLSCGGVHTQSTPASTPSGQGAPGMANMPGMGAPSSTDMKTMMKQCAEMRTQMKAGMKMTLEMQPMMDRCNKMDRSMGSTKAPDDTLSR